MVLWVRGLHRPRRSKSTAGTSNFAGRQSLPPGVDMRVSRQLPQPCAGEQVGRGDGEGICPHELDQSGAGYLRGEWLAKLLEVLLLGLAAAGRVRRDRRPTEVGERRDSG